MDPERHPDRMYMTMSSLWIKKLMRNHKPLKNAKNAKRTFIAGCHPICVLLHQLRYAAGMPHTMNQRTMNATATPAATLAALTSTLLGPLLVIDTDWAVLLAVVVASVPSV